MNKKYVDIQRMFPFVEHENQAVKTAWHQKPIKLCMRTFGLDVRSSQSLV